MFPGKVLFIDSGKIDIVDEQKLDELQVTVTELLTTSEKSYYCECYFYCIKHKKSPYLFYGDFFILWFFYFLRLLCIQTIIPTTIIIKGKVNITTFTVRSSASVGAYVTVECVKKI